MKKSEMFELLTVAFLQWPKYLVSEALSDLWLMAFKDHDKNDFKKALLATILNSTSGFPPTIGEVNAMLKTLVDDPSENLTEGEVWGILLRAIKDFGSYQENRAQAWLESKAPRIAQLVRIMGWKEICSWKIDDEPANRAHVWRVYLGVKTRDVKTDSLGLNRVSQEYELSDDELIERDELMKLQEEYYKERLEDLEQQQLETGKKRLN